MWIPQFKAWPSGCASSTAASVPRCYKTLRAPVCRAGIDKTHSHNMPLTFDPATEIGDLSDKTILVTGGNAGLGAATVTALAAHNPKCLYLCCRTRATGEAVVESIHQEHPQACVEILALDLSDLDSVKQCAEDFHARSEQLDILILNAGVSSSAYQTTKQGYEWQYVISEGSNL